MLYTFFVTQWNNPTRGDWTLEVKQDLEDFGIPCSFELIQSKSKLSFKNMVKVRAEEYAFKSLRRKQNTHSQNGKPDLQLIKNATVSLQSRNQNIRKEDNFQVPYKDGKIWQTFPGGTGTHSMPTVSETPG